MKKIDDAFRAKPIEKPKQTTCGRCIRGVITTETPKGYKAYRCDCWIGKELAEQSEVWASVKMLAKNSEMPINLNDPNYQKGLEWFRKNRPKTHRLIPDNIKTMIKSKIPF